MRSCTALSLVLAACSSPVPRIEAMAAGPPVVAVRAKRLLDPETGAVTPDAVLLIDGSRVRAAGRGLDLPPGSEVIDLGDATVLPGFFDCHTHLCARAPRAEGTDFAALLRTFLGMTLMKTTGYRALEGAAHAREMLEAGFTTVRDLGNAGLYADTDLRLAIEEGLVPGPTVVNAGRIIAPFGGQFARLSPERRDLGQPEYFYADTRDELRKAIRENIHYGAKVIKVVVDDQAYVYSPDDVRFVVEEAGRAGLKVAAHALTRRGARHAIEAGVASLEHGPDLGDDELRLMKEKGVVLVGTDFTEEVVAGGGLPPDWHRVFVSRLRRAHRAGVTLAFGTDVFNALPGRTRGALAIEYVESFLEVGVPPLEIVRALTTNAARLLGVERERGRLAPGTAADLVAVRGDPLRDPRLLKSAVFVMKDGKVVKAAR
jgi:imidazolonepropionase-like amidohydrolase